MKFVVAAIIVVSLVFIPVVPASAAETCPSGQHTTVVTGRGGKLKRTECESTQPSSSRSQPPSQTGSQRPAPSVVPSSIKGVVLIGGRPAVDRQLNVGFQSGVDQQAVHQRVGLAVAITSIAPIHVDTVTISTSGADAILAAIARYQAQPEVRYAEPNWTVSASTCEDPFRPQVQISTGSGQQSVTITGTKLAEVRFTRLDNATVEVSGVSHTQAFAVSVRDASVSIIVRRAQPGMATTVQMSIVDECGGVFNTFVGGGVNAF